MKNFTNLCKKLFCCILVASFCVTALASCGTESSQGEDSSAVTDSGERASYTVNVKSASGAAMTDIDVYIYNDEALSDMQDFAKTNADGTANFSLNPNSKNSIVLSGVPKGYDVQTSYSFNGNSVDIVLTSSLITDEELSTATLGVGDVMYDFTVMEPDGTEIKLSDILKEKKMVMLNFWYTTCSWCLTEFPIMDEVYQEYKDEIEIIALDPLDDNNAIQSFQTEQGLSFPMASCPSSWANTFGITGYPTSVFIDRYGVICVVEASLSLFLSS